MITQTMPNKIKLDMSQFDTIFESVNVYFENKPDEIAFRFINPKGDDRSLTYREFDVLSRQYAAYLLKQGLKQGDVVILVMDHSAELISAYYGAMRVGIIPSVFPYYHHRLNSDHYCGQVLKLANRIEASAILVRPELFDAFDKVSAETACQLIPQTVDETNEAIEFPTIDRSTTAFLQFSSGTTGQKKGVMISHRALGFHLNALRHCVELEENDVMCIWLPFHHDMGLIGGFFLALAYGLQGVYISPMDWMRDPKLLLHAVSQYKGTCTYMPNFAFNMLALGVRERTIEGIDLSSWRRILNGAEPVSHISLKLFLQRFQPYGLKESALMIGYGMAENTLAITLTRPNRPIIVAWADKQIFQAEHRVELVEEGTDNAMPLVSSGDLVLGVEAGVVNEDGDFLDEKHVGEIVLRGESLFSGYYKQPDITAESFLADGWFLTGDLGFLRDGQVYVTGRKKDLIISGGKNIYPKDLEEIAMLVRGVKPGRTVSFGVFNEKSGTEQVILLVEVSSKVPTESYQDIRKSLRKVVAQTTEVSLADVRIVEPGWILKTTSGKVARALNRKQYLKQYRQK